MRVVAVAIDDNVRRLTITEAPDPQPGPGELLVAVKAVSLNHGEVSHALFEAPDGHRPGWDFAGVVLTAPQGAEFAPGQRVFGMVPQGAWGEKVGVPTALAAAIPDTVSFEAAATLPVAGMTAAIAISKRPLKAGERLLVTAATGGVGAYAIQLGREAAAHVTAFTRNAVHESLLRDLGAHDVAVGQEAVDALAPFDLILEGTGGALLGRSLEWMNSQGACVLFGDAAGDQTTTFDARRFRLGGGGLFGGTMLYGLFLGEELMRPNPILATALLTDLAERMAASRLRPSIGRLADWTEIDTVARALLRREFTGKAVLRLS